MNNLLKLVILVLGILILVSLKIEIDFYLTQSNSSPNIDGEVVLGIIAFVFAVLIGASSAVYLFLVKHFEEINQKQFDNERNLSKADIYIAQGVFYMKLYRTLYKEKTYSQDKDGKAKEEIENAIKSVTNALSYLNNLNNEVKLYPRYLCLARNNYIYYLARKWHYYKENSEEKFKQLLNSYDSRAYEYDKERRIALEYSEYLKIKNASSEFSDLAHNFVDTFRWVEKVFSTQIETQLK